MAGLLHPLPFDLVLCPCSLCTAQSGRWNQHRCATFAPNICRLLRGQEELFGTPPRTDPHCTLTKSDATRIIILINLQCRSVRGCRDCRDAGPGDGPEARSGNAPAAARRPEESATNSPSWPHCALGADDPCGSLPGEVREWEEGKVIAFDDSFVHEVRVRPLHPSSTLVRGIEMRLKNMRASASPLLSAACIFQGRFDCCFASGYYTQHGLSAAGVAQRD